MSKPYDVIILGARCAGSPTAMLLARKGYRVLAVDKATFPSDTVSTHVLQPMAVAALARWGLLERLTATGCPPVTTFMFDLGPFVITGAPGTDLAPHAYCPRRTVLDKVLVDAAVDAGAEIREGFSVERLVMESDRVVGIEGHGASGQRITERAAVVVGADGRHSLIAKTVRPEDHHQKPPLESCYYTYFSELSMIGRFEVYIRPNRGVAAMPTHDGLTLVLAGWPYGEFEANKKDVEGAFQRTIELHPAFAARVRGAKREARLAGAAVPNFFRKPWGPGWVLVGDARYCKDPITAQGIRDSFDDAEACSGALDRVLGQGRSFDDAMAEYQRVREEDTLPIYELTCEAATLQPPPPDMQQLLGRIHGNQKAMDAFVRMNAGTISPREFFAPDHLRALMEAA
jgi:2-polyprenyl-6-methoxyphenol hydroxylase-like FAD-dependent oxidoreductase